MSVLGVDRGAYVCALFAACAVAGCGGSPVAPQAPAVAGPIVAVPAPPPPPDVSAVAEPPGLVVTGRLAKLSESLGTVHGWTGLPMPQSDQLSELMAGSAVGPIVDLDKPIDLAVASSAKGDSFGGLVAVAAGIRDPETAKTLLAERFKLVPRENGVLVLRPTPRQPDGSGEDGKADGERHPCEIAPAAGAATLRLVCGLDEASLVALGPWLARTAPRTAGGADAHFELHLSPLRQTIAHEWGELSGLLDMAFEGEKGVTSSMRDLAMAVVSDLTSFVQDLDTLAIDLGLSDAGATLTTTLVLPGSSSTTSRLLLANSDKNGPPPAVFWQMPSDADEGFFSRGSELNDYIRGRDLVLRVVADVLASEGVAERDRHVVVDALSELATAAPSAYASGVDLEAISKALGSKRALGDGADAAERAEARRVEAEAFLGWHVLEIDEPAAPRIDAIKALVAVWSRPAIQALYRSKTKGLRMEPPTLRAAPMPPSKSPWPHGAQHFVVEVFPPSLRPEAGAKGGKGKSSSTKPLVLHGVIAPDGNRSWMGFGGDALLVATKVAAAMAGTGGGLATRAELSDMKTANVGSAGFATSRAFAEVAPAAAALTGDDVASADAIFDEVSQLPDQGVPIEFSVTPRQGSKPASAWTLRVAKGTIQSAVVSILRHGGF